MYDLLAMLHQHARASCRCTSDRETRPLAEELGPHVLRLLSRETAVKQAICGLIRSNLSGEREGLKRSLRYSQYWANCEMFQNNPLQPILPPFPGYPTTT